MAGLVRVSLGRLLNSNGCKTLLVTKNEGNLVRLISSKAHRDIENRPPKPAPWPYNERSYTLLNYIYDKTTPRLDENSKIVVVEGPVAAGKSKFAKHIAKEFDMLYMPEANLDMYYINQYGFDLRSLDPQLPELCRSWDVMDFLKNPRNKLATRFQIEQLQIKYSQYIDALAHVLSTGQGVVLDRCVYSDFIFTEAMFSQGYLSKLAKNKYYEFRDNIIGELLKPHLVIYLDVPVPKVIEKVQKRAIGYEKNSPVITPDYLKVMEKQYKQHYLKDMSNHAELLVYDWSDEGDMEIIVEDIERIDFNRYDKQDPQLKDWVYRLEEEWSGLRYKYADNKEFLMSFLNIPCWEIPEMVIEAEDADDYWQIMNNAPGQEYQRGYNTSMGDEGLLFKWSNEQRDTLPLIERRQS